MKIGDYIAVVDEDVSGTITSLRGNVVFFEDEEGFIHQYAKEKLLIRNTALYNNIAIQHKKDSAKIKSKKNTQPHFVLDLHFEKLVNNPTKYGSFERLFLQKEKLLETLDFCRNNKLKKLEIIHGIGQGTLQKMVYEILENQVELEFDAHHFNYHSSGSVMVYFK